ncbi:hypothetical protein CkaCkLH20_05718 [Colletotrichum karsti]|uniref:Uncharacterized protein n=1 Tax=Colletotrichum karsti TaxID=1095194 RepID=A0A9P6LLS0_9PEZI|nr:uncharacterized protein CkaCkLH20_05718 [Colletotrichum karsti]KAF9876872.1 hypothetical protein CkaCkLH20_05718 [Colletotrichum karsti]
MSSRTNISAGTTSGERNTTINEVPTVMLDEYLANPPTVTEIIANGKPRKHKAKQTERELKEWEKAWEKMGSSKKHR